jgi:transcriptional regulator with XRE-family HTH domain
MVGPRALPYVGPMSTMVGPLVRDWRLRRRRSQMDLALDVGVSPRHLSFVETGRSRPSPELLLSLADRLEVPLRDRNTLLLAAGYAPRYRETPIGDDAMTRVRATLRRLLDGHDPYPGVVIDRVWNIVVANDAAARLTALLPPELCAPPVNVFRACLHPAGLARLTLNLPEWGGYLVNQLERVAASSGDPVAAALLDEVSSYPGVAAMAALASRPARTADPVLLVPWRVGIGGAEWSFFTTLTSFGTPQDVTLAELAVELFCPADDATEARLRTPTPGP